MFFTGESRARNGDARETAMFDRTQEWIQPYLNPDEQVIWAGRPRVGVILRASDWFVIPFSLVWGGGACVAAYSMATSSAPLFAKLFAGVFVLAAIYLVIGRFFADAARRKKICYALTDKRVLAVSQGGGGNTKSISLRSAGEIILERKADRSGTVAFGPMQPEMFRVFGSAPNFPQPLMFEDIPNAGEVYQMVLDAQQKAQRSG